MEIEQEIKQHKDRLEQMERAILQINHFTEEFEKLNLAEWKGNINGQLIWIKLLMGAAVIAGIGNIIATLISP